MVGKIFREKFPVFVITDQHFLLQICNFTFVCNVWSCQRIVSCYHYAWNFCSFQILNSVIRLLLKFVFEHFESIKTQSALGLMSLDLFRICCHLLGSDRQNSETSWSIFFQCFVVRIRNGLLVHDLEHNFGRSFAITVNLIFVQWIRCDYTHPLNVWVKFKPSINDAFVISLTSEWKYNIRIVLWAIQFKLPEFK